MQCKSYSNIAGEFCMDNLTREQRHKNMKNIHAKNTKIEVILRKALWNKGYRYRKIYKKIPGSPDIVLTKYNIAIFVMESSFMERIGKYLNPDWRKVITVSSGLVRYPETESGMMK